MGAVPTPQAQKPMGYDPAFQKRLKLGFDKLRQAGPGFLFDLGQEGLDVVLDHLIERGLLGSAAFVGSRCTRGSLTGCRASQVICRNDNSTNEQYNFVFSTHSSIGSLVLEPAQLKFRDDAHLEDVMVTTRTDGTFEWNDELLLDPSDQDWVKTTYPNVAFALINQDVIHSFPALDERAKALKARFRTAGFATIGGTLLTLVLAALEPLILLPAVEYYGWPKQIGIAVAICAATLGLVTVCVGWFGMGISARKMKWLTARFASERVRQWHWQYLVANLHEIAVAAASDNTKRTFRDKREKAFKRYLHGLGNSTFSQLSEQSDADVADAQKTWHAPEAKNIDPTAAASLIQSEGCETVAKELLRAIREIRFEAQERYVRWILSDSGFWLHPATQLRYLQGATQTLLVIIAGLHIAILVGVLATIPELKSPYVYALILISALTALALHAIEVGLRPTEQQLRLRNYRSDIQSAMETFNFGKFADQVAAARDLEQAAAQEMREFISSVSVARYIM